MRAIIAIDPGQSGGFATIDADGTERACHMPDGMTAIVDALLAQRTMLGGSVRAVIENVGFSMPGNGKVGTATFARHVGHLEAALYCLGIPTEKVSPQKWQKSLGAFSKDYDQRKKQIKELMARRYPHIVVTLATADALGMLTWAMAHTS